MDLTYRDQNTAVVTYSADWQNKRQRAEVNVLKKEKKIPTVYWKGLYLPCAIKKILSMQRAM